MNKSELLRIIGSNIKFYREKLSNFSQSHIASELNISATSLSHIENGKSDITISRLESIAKILKVDILTLLNKEDDIKDSIINNFYNNSGNKGVNIMYQNQLEIIRHSYEASLKTKDEFI